MTTPVLALTQPNPNGIPARKKRVLLLDTSQTKRDLRADVMRKLGIDVDCAADILEARSWWRADLYDLVLINVAGETGSRDEFCIDLRGATPPQRIAFLVGGPEYLATAPHSDEAPPEPDAEALHKELVATLLAQGAAAASQRWGILEACKKISSVRAISEARSRALRETPRPSRWAEAIEQHSVPAPFNPRALFAKDTVAAETFLKEPVLAESVLTESVLSESVSADTEREELL
jgi:CheY-like chemotaxis protein